MLVEDSLDADLLWSGEEVHHRGEAYTVDGLAFRPTPVERPGIPVWVAGRYPFRAPLRRAARYDGVFPIDLDTPQQLAEVMAVVDEHRPDPEPGAAPYEVAVLAPPGGSADEFAEAGATWWFREFDQVTLTAAEVRAVLADGPF